MTFQANPAAQEELDDLVARVKVAQKIYATFSQEKVDKIFRDAAFAAAAARIPLAKMAAEESGMGVVEDKVVKNHFASEYIYNKVSGVQSIDSVFLHANIVSVLSTYTFPR